MINSTISLLANTEYKRVFDKVLEARWIRFDKLVEKTGIDPDMVREALQELEKDDLVAKKGAPLEDLTVYYITTKGLRANRRMSRFTLV
jgi:DNA-binding HxlR family transcriptional regulator